MQILFTCQVNNKLIFKKMRFGEKIYFGGVNIFIASQEIKCILIVLCRTCHELTHNLLTEEQIESEIQKRMINY